MVPWLEYLLPADSAASLHECGSRPEGCGLALVPGVRLEDFLQAEEPHVLQSRSGLHLQTLEA